MKIAVLNIVFAILLCSCTTYLDRGKNINSEYLDFNYFENYNEFIYKSRVNSIADNERYSLNHFSLNLPKNIKNWQSSGNEFYFEFNNKEIIYVNSGIKDVGKETKWLIRETNNDEIINKLSFYWSKRKYNENYLERGQSNKVSKVYTNGKVTILLYNIKKVNLEKYLLLINSFKYLN